MFIQVKKSNDKTKNYLIMLDSLEHFLYEKDTEVTALSNLSAFLNYFLDDINWVGFYLYNNDKLVLGPFQGLPACTEIKLGNGVCGNSAKERITYIVNDVNTFPGHIACDSNSSSEIVIPIVVNNQLYGVLDIDSPIKNRFDQIDKEYLEKVIDKLVDIVL
ncbi:Free methionine-R-sulfoxide reductase [Candidatus Izimaplasma bacterium HR1]|uniref:GAF domain-containing protein n=1 Tax=Candidatus Izimoplasma sp. HR1 TaxID=1541959 RepID=UPI0004F73463|nr:Free methionine-R-sulfoxide reductase [Candidatus Izimaplasma bacterium HR1]